MAKYIRTTNGIYQYGIGGQSHPPYFCVPNFDGTKLLISEGLAREYPIEEQTILNQDDDIEKVCDMFVVGGHGKMPVEMPLSETEQYEKMKKIVLEGMKLGWTLWLKLAIWTDKGLIYAAKMNDKEDFDLL